MKQIFPVLILLLGLNAFAADRPGKTQDYRMLNKIIAQSSKKIEAESNGSLTAASYSFYDHEGRGLVNILTELEQNECWGRCETQKTVQLKKIDTLKSFPTEETSASEYFEPNFLKSVKAKILEYDQGNEILYFTAVNCDDGSYWSESLYIVVIDSDDKNQFEIYKIEYLEGK